MPRNLYRVALAVAAAAALLAAGARPAPAAACWPMRQEGADWLVETPNYFVKTDLGPDVAQTVATHQEVLYAELYRRMGKIRALRMRDRFTVHVYQQESRYLGELGAIGGSRGIFMPSKDVLACWGAPRQLDLILQTLRHEGTHQFVAHFIGQGCPVWLNEGLAVFYEHGRFQRGRLEIGQVAAGRVALLRQAIAKGTLIPLAHVLGMSNAEWVDNVSSGRPEGYLQYCQAWSMVHFLAYGSGKKYQPAFLAYMKLVSQGRRSIDAWERTFGANLQGFEACWKDYVQGLRPSVEPACRAHLEVLGWLLTRADPQHTADLATFRQAVVEGRLGEWRMRLSSGFEISSTDKKTLASLFRCPDDRGKDGAPSYELVPGRDGEPPVVRCRHHKGKVLQTAYEKDAKTGAWSVRVVAGPAAGSR